MDVVMTEVRLDMPEGMGMGQVEERVEEEVRGLDSDTMQKIKNEVLEAYDNSKYQELVVSVSIKKEIDHLEVQDNHGESIINE